MAKKEWKVEIYCQAKDKWFEPLDCLYTKSEATRMVDTLDDYVCVRMDKD